MQPDHRFVERLEKALAITKAKRVPMLLDDAAVNIDEWVAEEVRIAFAEQENTAFVSGDGSNKPKGFLHYTKVAEASWAWDSIGFIETGGRVNTA